MGCMHSTPVVQTQSAAPANAAAASTAPLNTETALTPTSAPESAPATEAKPDAEAEAAPAAEDAAPAETTDAVADAAAEAAPANAPSTSVNVYKISGVSISELGTVFYVIERATGDEWSIKKRYNDFKQLYSQLDTSALPPLPAASFATLLRGKHNQALLKSREIEFTAILNSIAHNPTLAESEAFQKFMA